ncbi:hypothetical protein AAFF_G00086180 [Aldrovandia affinis]|uniref:Uncharacterized protein n=1 Tax=Aldrovandia affinis TaxID=143900 RepID=A0AAD7RWW5_9TELE|nr:hypothetical protein AAFF_G00086180 [Aldrovandia affinis]
MPPATPKSRAKKGRGSTSPGPPQVQNPDTSDVVPGRLTKSEWVAMVMLEEGEEAVAWILDELMDHVMEGCYRVYLHRQLIPFTVSKVRDALVQVMEWQFLMQDRGEGLDCTPLWVEDSEPQACETDSWARGAVPLYSPPPPTILPKRITEPAVGKAATPKPKPKAWSVRQATAVHNDSTKDQKDRTEHPGVTSVKPTLLFSAPQKKRGERGKQPSPHQAGLPALKTPPLHLLRLVLGCAVSQEEQDLPTQVIRATPQPRPPDFPATQRLNPNHQPRQYICPGFEVLNSSSVPLPPGKKEVRKLQAPTLYEGFSEGQRRGAPAGPVCVFSTTNIQGGGQAQGFTPLAQGLLLGTIKFSPGVSIRDPHGAPSNSFNVRSQPKREADLKPIRSALPPAARAGPADVGTVTTGHSQHFTWQ